MFQLLATALLLWGLWASPLGKAKRTGLVLLVLALVFSLWTTVEYFMTCEQAAEKVKGNATSFTAKLRSLLGYKAAKDPKNITKTGDFNTRMRNYQTLRNDMAGLPSRITANCASYTEAKLKKAVVNSDSNVSDIQKYEAKVAKAK
jgi:hypothetical protein